ncbi:MULTISPECIES: chromosomal replication initiator protein DnaA [Pseudobutyrivibrio]|jgi:chromosomal replication initiator protein|uniref:Chromosomal replication initiator protein DnaA n=2 Tax=Pseudobutyrivibrio TaxID=46205 RepID=A0A2G3DWP7_9FIRM|nr:MULTISPECIES: chromosomal replication initiator protein DnaA [Pseudobutyrivibrio]MBE5904428.1 chromosomal replication initiator protein DnaA [Pseudobutyrivibrio sp.]NEX02063.1 chromosomal replication initiator protein DnaA [Pseudobutyrivibrio xylanivorans]PHU35456.1 chromosomal replication initiator protein DnaA [Pseudobutyrivibrio ruminis]PHU40599.1 chromosomal replication initiator protein DnaA [Pseudobutyrivibrio ruminis]SCY11751.1 chromosomal replication initiator protein DnaA [Pseudobu
MEEIVKKWDEILAYVKTEYVVAEVSYESWLKPLELFQIEDNKLYIIFNGDQSSMTIGYVTRKFGTPIKVSIAELTGNSFEEIVIISQEEANKLKADNDTQHIKIEETPLFNNKKIGNSTINPKFTFDNFVVGRNNRFAQTAALAVAESPGEFYNPLYIYGGPGLGKTHLMQAIGNYIENQNPSTHILYVTSEEFTNEVIENMRTNNNATAMQRFRDKYRTVDVLMVDDIQFIIGKEATQEEFFHTFNALHAMGKQIVISSDKPPKDMETLDDRFKSRFDMGLMADIGYPDYETRMAILNKKIEEKNFNLDESIRKYIAENIQSNIREIEGALNKLIAFSRLEKIDITMDIAERELQNFISPNISREITPQLIIEVVSEHFGITVDQMASKNRSSNVVRPRQIAMYLCNTMTDSSLQAIGVLLGGRDHSTIIHGANKIEEEINKDDSTKSLVETIKKKINPN